MFLDRQLPERREKFRENGYVPFVSSSISPIPPERASEFPSEAFVDLLRQKDRNAFETLYDKYSGALYGLVLKIVKEPGIAEDVLQDCFVRVFRKIHTYDPAKGRLFTWMLNIARNLAIDVLRSGQHQMAAGSVQMQTTQLEQVVPASTMAVDHIGLQEVLDTLPDSQREVLHLLYYQGYSQSEVAKRLNLPLGTVKSKVRLGMGALRKKLLDTKGGAS